MTLAILALVVAPWQSFAQPAVTDGAAGESLRLLTSSEQAIVLELRLPVWEVSTHQAGGFEVDEISVPGFDYTSDVGTPRLPVKFVTLGIPPGAAPQVQVLEADGPRIETGYQLAANPFPTRRFDLEIPSSPPAPQVKPASGDELYPAELAQVVEVGRLRSQSFVQIRLNPFQYHPRKQELRVYDRLQVAVRLNGSTPGPQSGPVDEGPFEPILRALLLNYAEAKAWRALSPAEAPGEARLQDFYAGIRFRIEVSQDGLYELDGSTLQAEDPDIADYLLSTFQLFEDFNLSEESEVALEVVDNDSDDWLDSADVVRFYGRRPDENELRYTATRVYWLVAGREPGKRMQSRSAPPGSGAIPADFPTTVHVEENHKYSSNLPELGGSDTHWYWVYLVHVDPGSPLQRDYALSTPGLSPVGHPSTVRAKLVGRTADHWTKLYVNGIAPDNLVADQTWDGQIGVEIAGDIASSKLNSGANTIWLEMHLQPGVGVDALYVDWFEIEYRRAFVAQEDRLAFTRPTGYSEYQVTGFGGSDVGVYDVTAPRDVVRLTDTQTTGGTLRFRDETEGAEQYIAVRLQTPALMEPDSVVRVDSAASLTTDLRAAGIGANYLIITHADFTTAANQLAAFRSADFTALVVQVQDIYNQFGNSVLDPEAIHDFLAYAVDNWSPSPQYVLLMGDGSYDYRGYLGEPRANYIPPYMDMVDPWMGETADENYYAAVSGGDIVPDLFVGRAPVNTLAEANAFVDKVIGHEGGLGLGANQVGLSQTTPDPSALFVADKADPRAGDFPRLADEIAADCLPDSYSVQKVYFGETHTTPSEVRSAIMSNIDQGQRFVNYIGHAGVTQWGATYGFFGTSDVDGLSNAGKFPVVLGMTCLEGSFQDALQDAVAEEMVRSANKGAIASWSPAGMGVATGHDKLNRGFYDALFQDDVRRLGPAAVAGKVQVYNTGSNLDLVHAFALLGDPATDSGVRACLADVNDDGAVDVVDIMLVASRWHTSCENPDPDGNLDTPNYEAQYDLDEDCEIDIVDIMLVAARWGDVC